MFYANRTKTLQNPFVMFKDKITRKSEIKADNNSLLKNLRRSCVFRVRKCLEKDENQFKH